MAPLDRSNRPLMALLLSAAVWPGAGQVYNGERPKGALLALAAGAVVAAVFVVVGPSLLAVAPLEPTFEDVLRAPALARAVVDRHWGALLGLHVALAVVWIVAVVDAWRVARRQER